MEKLLKIIGIGASAGGLDALKTFFSFVPPNPGVTFVVIQHLARNYNSELAYLLRKHTSLKVIKVTMHEKVKPNHVYVIKENCKMLIKSGTLYLRERPLSEIPNIAIDYFLKSLAEDSRQNAIAIILSGSGSDGVEGIKAVKANGGIVMVQNPNESLFDGMPNHAIKFDHPDFVGSLEELANKVMEVALVKSDIRPVNSKNE